MNAASILKQIKDEEIRYVDLRFTDPKGKWQHLTMVASVLGEGELEDGLMFDGSSIAGWKAINESDIAKKGIFLRKFGQEIIRITSGKRVHGTGAIPGGINKLVTAAERDSLKRDLPQMLQWAQDSVDIAKQLHAQNPALYNQFGTFRSKRFMWLGKA